MTQDVTIDGRALEAVGWTGRLLEFRPDGTEIVNYDHASPIEVDAPAGRSVEVWRGVAVYQVSTSDDTLTFESGDFTGTSVTWTYAGEPQTYRPRGISPPVAYTCDETRHTQRSDRYEATFVRLP